jgi:hypothetical protein
MTLGLDLMALAHNSGHKKPSKITAQQYLDWQRLYTLEALKGHLRYGQSFCNQFDITDNILFYMASAKKADCYIWEHYIDYRN